jgi:hypothetical protein
MRQLHNAIIGDLEKEFLHSLRIEDKQLEALYRDVEKEVEALPATA